MEASDNSRGPGGCGIRRGEDLVRASHGSQASIPVVGGSSVISRNARLSFTPGPKLAAKSEGATCTTLLGSDRSEKRTSTGKFPNDTSPQVCVASSPRDKPCSRPSPIFHFRPCRETLLEQIVPKLHCTCPFHRSEERVRQRALRTGCRESPDRRRRPHQFRPPSPAKKTRLCGSNGRARGPSVG